MRDRPTNRPSLDDAIDEAVRSMMNVDPAADFDGRVLRRLERPPRQPFAWPRLATAAAALAAIVLLAVVLSRPSPDPRQAPAPAASPHSDPALATRTPVPEPHSPSVPTATPQRPSTSRPSGTRPRVRQPIEDRVTAAALEAASIDEPPIAVIAALEPPSALAVEDIQQQPVDLPEITLSRLEIDELELQPLRPLDERREE